MKVSSHASRGIRRLAVALAAGLVLGGLTGCGDRDSAALSHPESDGGRPRIVATTTMLADLVRTLAGEDFAVASLMAPGVDPHTYEMPARAIALIRGADAVIYNGHLLEGKIPDLLAPLASQGKHVLAVAESLPAESLIHPDGDFAGHADPHVWGDVRLWKSAIAPVADILKKLRPDRADAIAARAAAYAGELDALDAWIRQQIASLPEANRLIMTSHDAFGYFGRAYGIDVIGVQGISTATEAGLADIVGAVDLIRQRGVRAIFVESSVSRAVIERIARDAGVSVGGELYSDSTGPAGNPVTIGGETWDAGTYIGMMRHNVSVIVEALR